MVCIVDRLNFAKTEKKFFGRIMCGVKYSGSQVCTVVQSEFTKNVVYLLKSGF